MVFSSTVFLFLFLPVTLIIYYVINKKVRNLWLLLVSVIFFAWSQPNYLWIIITSIIVNYFSALFISRAKNIRFKKFILIFSILANVGLLYYFKYFNFTIDIINKIFNTAFDFGKIVLPIGISFFTFQGLSYVIDVYKDNKLVQKNFLKLALYIVLFPQLIAGPIVRYTDISSQIDEREIGIDTFYSGIQRFIIGLFKKVIIANTLAVVADGIWNAGVTQNTISIAWLGIISYSLQIFFDFSGYSDMAIGLGRMFGFTFCENFNLPYISSSVTEFWRRWHISLSTWFRDYVYIPLGGNRKHVYINLAIVFLLTGIWHGASYNFIFWGIWHGFFILIERYLKKHDLFKIKSNLLVNSINHIYTLFVVVIGWVFFRANGLKHAIKYILTMFGISCSQKPGYNVGWYLDNYTISILIIALILSSNIPTIIVKKINAKFNNKILYVLKNIFLILIFIITILRIVSNSYNPFIYFQF